MSGVTSRQLACIFAISAFSPLFALRGAGIFPSAADFFVFCSAYCAVAAAAGLAVLSSRQRDMGMLNLPLAAVLFVFAGLASRELYGLWAHTEQGAVSPLLFILLLLALVVYALSCTVESFARLAPFSAAALAAALAVLLGFAVSDAETANLIVPRYVWKEGYWAFFARCAAAPLGFLALSSQVCDRRRLRPCYVKFIAASFAAAACAVFVCEAVVGDYAYKALYPMYSLASSISFKGSDALLAVLWLVCGITNVLGLVFAGHNLVRRAFPSFSKRKTCVLSIVSVAAAAVLGVFI